MKDKKSISLQVDNGPKTEGRIPRKLDVQAPVYVGGLPSSFTPMFGLVSYAPPNILIIY